jgi:hypothetical protein
VLLPCRLLLLCVVWCGVVMGEADVDAMDAEDAEGCCEGFMWLGRGVGRVVVGTVPLALCMLLKWVRRSVIQHCSRNFGMCE